MNVHLLIIDPLIHYATKLFKQENKILISIGNELKQIKTK